MVREIKLLRREYIYISIKGDEIPSSKLHPDKLHNSGFFQKLLGKE